MSESTERIIVRCHDTDNILTICADSISIGIFPLRLVKTWDTNRQ